MLRRGQATALCRSRLLLALGRNLYFNIVVIVVRRRVIGIINIQQRLLLMA
jgi:hypothetical protein